MRSSILGVGVRLALCVLAIGWGSIAHAQERRVALVIGNSAYEQVARLRNAARDAEVMGAALKALGFSVTVVTNQTAQSMRQTLREFSDVVRGADVALFFFAGHGLQMSQRDQTENYLIPVDARLSDARDLEDEAVGLSRLLQLMDGARARIVILDACRDNPMVARMAGASATRSVARGLAPIRANGAEGTLIVFSTAPGAVAADGDGSNSPFAEALLRHMVTPGLEIRGALTRVRAEVARASSNTQVPWSNDGLLDELFLAGGASSLVAGPVPATGDIGQAPSVLEATLWAGIQASDRGSDFDDYLARFPSGSFSGAAQNRLIAIRGVAEVRQPADNVRTPGVRPWSGLNIATITEETARRLGLPGQPRGALVARTQSDGPMDRAGVRADDIILAIGGIEISEMRDFPRAFGRFSPGQVIPVLLFSDGQMVTRQLVVGRFLSEETSGAPRR